ncbi:2-phospho-L-lactate guanylyltransferase [Falsiroseomonas oryzae]|uniref:2-phospho-L-lactate guanylyltransferase n=1 Tax=Falsiroseomonas oryzae TaxID=2766473 RepID=UPI0022EAD905|nr:2-phospho-L-lactate guanylyltransferase [Roseomonas sp. MO-31]
MSGVHALLPIKLVAQAKQRLARALSAEMRARLALAMAEDVLAALAATPGLAGITVVTADPAAAALAERYGARVIQDGALDGHTGAVLAGTRRLAAEDAAGVLALPLDVPCVTPAEIAAVLDAHGAPPAFTIVPSHDRMGSNCVVVSPPGAVPLRFGDDSFAPHLAAARAAGIAPRTLDLPGLALDIDHPADLAALLRRAPTTRAHALLAAASAPQLQDMPS